MGKRDYNNRETKKPKKDQKKLPLSTSIISPAEVDVIKKGKKTKPEDEL